ncbi:MAG TPA: phosphatase PAP2 family protein [Vicinamibacterales bacterium]|jgi:membrane-associated phospholipid phosphatase
MFPSERLAVVYFSLFAAAVLVAPGRLRRWRGFLGASGSAAGVILIASMASITARMWLCHAYLVAGYWLPAVLVSAASSPAFESWLQRSDLHVRRYLPQLPRWTTHFAELSYLMCYPALPAAFVVVWTWGTLVDAERFWASVLAAGFTCYGSLPWLPSRPPRLLERFEESPALREAPFRLATVNTAVLARVSHQLNTFPSGHVAVAVAAASSAFSVWWPAGLALGVVAAGIAIGAVAGRYHYVVDVILGAIVGFAAVAIFQAF